MVRTAKFAKTDVLVMAHNQKWVTERFLRHLEKVTDAKVTPYRFILVDNGSTDGTREVLASWATKTKGVFVGLESNMGPGIGRNRGLQFVKADYVAMLDNDLFVPPHWLEHWHMVLASDPRIAWAAGIWYVSVSQVDFDADNIVGEKSGLRWRTDLPGSGLIRRAAIEEIGGYDEGFYAPIAEDSDLGRRLSIRKWKLMEIQWSVCHHEGKLLTPWDLGSTRGTEKTFTPQDYRKCYDYFCDKWGKPYYYPKCSIVMPAKNADESLADALLSCIDQGEAIGEEKLEIVVALDGSPTPEGKEVLDDCRKLLGERLVVIGGEWGNISAARNAGNRAATGRIIVPMDADDEFLTGEAVKKLVDCLIQNRTVGLAYANEIVRLTDSGHGFTSKKAFPPNMFAWEQVSHPVAYWKELWESIGGYNEEYPRSDSYYLYTRLQEVTDFALIPDVLYLYNLEPAGIGSEKRHLQATTAQEILEKARERRLWNGMDVPDGDIRVKENEYGVGWLAETRMEAVEWRLITSM